MAQESRTTQAPIARVPWYARARTFRSFQHGNWLVLWLAGHLWHLALWMDLLVLGWLVLELTNSPFLVSLIGAFRFLPLGIVGIVFGSLGDRLPKKRMLVAAQVVNTLATVSLTALLLLDVVQVWHIFLTTLVTGTAWAADFPVRRAFIRELVPEHSAVNALSLDAASMIGMSMVGRFLGGGLLALAGAEGAYVFLSVCYIIGLVLLSRIPSRPLPRATEIRQESMLMGLKKGLRFCVTNPAVRGVLIVTVLFNVLVTPYVQLTPVFARDILGVGPALLGLMAGMDGFGALVGAMALASAGNIKRLGLVLLLGTITMSIAVFAFSLSRIYLLSSLLLVVAGLGLSGFATMQVVIPISVAPPEMRGRALGVIALSISSAPVGMTYVGFLANHLGAPMAVKLNSFACIVLLLVVMAFQPGLRRFSTQQEEGHGPEA